MTIILYNEDPNIDISIIADYLKEEMQLDIEARPSLISSNIDEIALGFAHAKIIDITRETENQPLPSEIEYEKKRLKLKEKGSLLYDGYRLQDIFRTLIPKDKRNCCNIIFIKELLATFDEPNKRYHLRVSLYGFPSIISVSGIVEAPAKPREYYIKKGLGVNEETLKEEFKGRFIDPASPDIPEILKGYALQAIFFHLTQNPFCENKNCRLYNSHWQEEMIKAQLTSGKLCKKHKEQMINLHP
ncbi:MAG: DUF6775 family putative metallopeptidase [bacterium]